MLGPQAGEGSTETTFWCGAATYVALKSLYLFIYFLSFLSVQNHSQYFRCQAVQVYTFEFYLHLITNGPALLGGYGERFRDPVTHLLDSPGKVSITGKCRTCGGCILEQNESEGSVGRRFGVLRW